MLSVSVFLDFDDSERLFGVFGKVRTWWQSFDPLAPLEDDDDNDEIAELNDDPVAEMPDESTESYKNA